MIFKILWKLLASGISGIHRQKDAEFGIHLDSVPVREDELPLFLSFAGQNDGDLLGGYRQDGQFDTIELVEAAPRSRLGQSFVNASQTAKVHLVRTVEDDDVFAQRFAHVFCCFRLARAGRPARTAAHTHVQGLGQSDVATIG